VLATGIALGLFPTNTLEILKLFTNNINSPVKEGEDERAGRWKGQKKTECGIHNSRSKYAQFLAAQELKKQEEALKDALEKVQLSQAGAA